MAAALPEWMQPGVRVGAGVFDKSLFLSLYTAGVVTDIERGEIRIPGKIELGVAGEDGAWFFDESGKLDNVVNFAVPSPNGARVPARIVKRTSSNGLLFFRQGGVAAIYDSLVDANGKEIWRTPYPVVASTFGDLFRDRAPEFIFGTQEGATEARDISGNVLWHRPEVGWANRLGVVSSDHGGSQILEAVNDGTLVGIGATGQLLFKRKPALDGFFSGFSTVRWEGVCDTPCLLVSRNERFQLVSADGQRPIALLGPGHYLYHAHAAAVRLYRDGPLLLAVAGLLHYRGQLFSGFEAVHGALYVFDSHWNLVYHEIFPEEIDALYAVPTADGKREALLVGGEHKVWKYAAVLGGAAPR